MASELSNIVLKKDDLTEVLVYLHGATVTSWKCKGNEMLFVSKQAVYDGKKAIRGGIPVVFPNFGPWKLGPQHGFARTQTWKVHKGPEKIPLLFQWLGFNHVTLGGQLQKENTDSDGNIVAILLLEDTVELRKIWDNNFKFLYTLTLKDCEFVMEVNIENTGTKEFEFTSLLHTYYNVASIDKVKIQGLKGCDYIDKVNGGEHKEKEEFLQITGNVDSVYKQTPKEHSLFTGNHNIRITKENFPDTVVWNPWIEKAKQMSDFGDDEYQQMVCVEPGYVSAPYKLQPKEILKAKQVLTCLC